MKQSLRCLVGMGSSLFAVVTSVSAGCSPGGFDGLGGAAAVDSASALTCNVRNEKRLWREGSCAFLACCSSYGQAFDAGTPGSFSCEGQPCKLGKDRAKTGKRYAPLFFCDGQAPGMDCDDEEPWLAVPGLKRTQCDDRYVVCKGGTMVTDVIPRDKSHNDGGGLRFEGSDGLFAQLDLQPGTGNALVSIYEANDPRIKTDPACGSHAAPQSEPAFEDGAGGGGTVGCSECGDGACDAPEEDVDTCPADCTNDPDPCAGSADPCCGSTDPCCMSGDPCCGSTDPCCGGACCDVDSDPCCGTGDPCCGIDCGTDAVCISGVCIEGDTCYCCCGGDGDACCADSDPACDAACGS